MRNRGRRIPKRLRKLVRLLRSYSFVDVASSLLVGDLWMPNRAAQMRRLWLWSVLAALHGGSLRRKRRIRKYGDFASFLGRAYPLLPEFPILEDYVPQADWGDIAFFLESRFYKIFYGCELENVYDQLTAFTVIFEGVSEEFECATGRDPLGELRACLRVQDLVLSLIDQQLDSRVRVDPGHLEVPPEAFWTTVVGAETDISWHLRKDGSQLSEFSISAGEAQLPTPRRFASRYSNGTELLAYSLEHHGRCYLMDPRRCTGVLLSHWSTIHHELNQLANATKLKISFCRFAQERSLDRFFFPAVSAMRDPSCPHDHVFSCAIISGQCLILITTIDVAELSEHALRPVSQELHGALNLLGRSPMRLALRATGQIAEFPARDGPALRPLILAAVPKLPGQNQAFLLPQNFPARCVSLDALLGVLDEVSRPDDLGRFLDYLDEHVNLLLGPLSLLDLFASFHHSQGVLVPGAVDFDTVLVDPLGGSSQRYETLQSFWEVYPRHSFLGEPRGWFARQETPTRVRLNARSRFAMSIRCRVGDTDIFLTGPFEHMDRDGGRATNMLLECAEDILSRHACKLGQLAMFQYTPELQIVCFPDSLVEGNDEYRHLRHLAPGDGVWKMDAERFSPGAVGVRVVFSSDALWARFKGANDRSVQVEFVTDVLERVDALAPDPNLPELLGTIAEEQGAAPRFKAFTMQPGAAFPQSARPFVPPPQAFARARKRMAQLARGIGLSGGHYELVEAKQRLNDLREALVEEIDHVVQAYERTSLLCLLVAAGDSVVAEREREEARIEHGLSMSVNYLVEDTLAEMKGATGRSHRVLTYLTEKAIQIARHDGATVATREAIEYLFALADSLLMLYGASDALCYHTASVGVSIDSQFLVEVEYDAVDAERHRLFAVEQARRELALSGNAEDRVSLDTKPLMLALDSAFQADLGFAFSDMTLVLVCLAQWPLLREGEEASVWYRATREEIRARCSGRAKIRASSVDRIIDFLTLKSKDVTRLLGQVEPCDDVPVWEVKRRVSRYRLQPLLAVPGGYLWGAFGARTAANIWTGSLQHAALPMRFEGGRVREVLDQHKNRLAKALVKRGEQVFRRYSPHVEKEVRLDRRDKQGQHPLDLGDYDLLVFLEDRGVVLSVECKDLLPPYTLKEARSVRDRIFGKESSAQSYVSRIARRTEYLKNEIVRVVHALEWPESAVTASILPLYVSRVDHWWTTHPPTAVECTFLRIEQLGEFVEGLEQRGPKDHVDHTRLEATENGESGR